MSAEPHRTIAADRRSYGRDRGNAAAAGRDARRDRREVTVLLILFAVPGLVFWAVTLEAFVSPSRPTVLIAGTGALACTLGYLCLAWRTRARRR
jgi:hypothetical protein